MRDMPLPFEAKGGLGFLQKVCHGGFCGGDWKSEAGFGGLGVVVSEPTSVLEAKRSPSPSVSTSTLSSSLAGGAGGGGSGDTASVATFSGNPSEKWTQHHPVQEHSRSTDTGGSHLDLFQHQMPASLETGSGGGEKCGGMEYWDADLLDPDAESPGQDQSVLRLIMGDMEDPSMGLNKLLQASSGAGSDPDLQFPGGGLLGMADQGFGLDPSENKLLGSPQLLGNLRNPTNQTMFTSAGNNTNAGFPIAVTQLNAHLQHYPSQNPSFEAYPDEKNHVLNHPQFLISHLQAQNNTQNPCLFPPLQNHAQMGPPPKRHNPGVSSEGHNSNSQFPKPGQFPVPQQLHLLPYMQNQNPRPANAVMATKPKMAGDEMMIQQQAIVDQLLRAAELIESGNPILAHEILARLNHHLSPMGKPFSRVCLYLVEALRLLLMNNNSVSSSPASPFNVFFKIGAYKSFSEISPVVQFANFTCNQAILESIEGFENIRIVDFDIGYGGQWASLMQELALRKPGPPAVKIVAFASPSTHDQLELSLTRENLAHFAREINMPFDFDLVNIDSLSSYSSWPAQSEAIAVNLPISALSTGLLRFVKQLSPKILVSVDRAFDRTDLHFANHIHQTLQSNLALLESLDSVNMNPEALQKIEAFLIRPAIEKLVSGRHVSLEKTPHWKTQFLSAGFSPVNFSNFTECQAEWLLKRTLARGFHIEKRQASLGLYFQRKELVSVSAWRCC